MNFHEKELKMLRMIMASIVTYLEMKKNYRKVNKIRKLDRVMQNQKNCLCFKKILDFYFLTNLHEKGLKMLEMIIVPIVTYLKMMKIANNNLIGRKSQRIDPLANAFAFTRFLTWHVPNTPN